MKNYLYVSPLPAAFLTLFFGVWGLTWGLPSRERIDLFLKPELKTPKFFNEVAKARDEIYNQVGLNPVAHYGKMQRLGKPVTATSNILTSYSSFLVRTHHGDEQQTLLMLSHLNPFQGQWYPHSFYYGGSYLFPLGFFLKCLETVHLIKLVPQATFYYEHPDEIAKVYLAARGWSLMGMALATTSLFYLGKELGGPRVGFWSSCFFALLPACLGTAKLAKPHVWAAAWTLTSIYFCVRARQAPEIRKLVLAALSFGAAVGTAMSQIAFLPFLLWACWTSSFRTTFQRAALVGFLSAAVFLATNFYLFAHFQDYRDEVYFISNWYPFAVRLTALWEFVIRGLRTSFGWVLWILVLGSVAYTAYQKKDLKMKQLVLVSLLVFTYEAFQNQSEQGAAVVSRLFLGLLGFWCVCAVWVLDRLPGRQGICVLSLGALLVTATFYDLHFASDRVPRDNASLVSLWSREHIPAGSTIVMESPTPHPVGFPPLDFSKYRFVQAASPAFDALRGPAFGILPAAAYGDTARALLSKRGYQRLKVFAESPIQKWGFSDPFTNANFALEIYAKPPSRHPPQ